MFRVALEYGVVGSGNPGEFLAAVAALVGIPIAVLALGRLFERVF